jgi:hypothetical protein
VAVHKKYWAVCYGHVCRWATGATASDAMFDAFGIRPSRFDAARVTVRQFPGNPKYMALKRRNPWLEDLFKHHKEKTGVEVK